MNKIKYILLNFNKKETFLVILIAFLITTGLLFKSNLMTYEDPNFSKPWDHHKYIFMALSNLLNFNIAPYCWRIGVPILVKFFPFDIQTNFLLLSFLSIWFTGVMVYFVSKQIFFTRTYAFIGMLMFFSLGWATKWIFYDFWLTDALSLLIIITAIYCIITKRDIYFFLLLYIGVLVKESVIFIAPLYYTFNTDRIIDIKKLKKIILLTTPAIIILISVRLLIPQMNFNTDYMHNLAHYLPLNEGDSLAYSYLNLPINIMQIRIENFSYGAFTDYFIRPFGVLLVAASAYSFFYNRIYLLRFFPFLLLVYLQLLFANNTERLLVFAFPSIIIFALEGLRIFTGKTKTLPADFIPLFVLLILTNVLIGTNQYTAPFRIQIFISLTYFAVILLFRYGHILIIKR